MDCGIESKPLVALVRRCSCESRFLHPLPWQLPVPVHLGAISSLSVTVLHCGSLTPQQRSLGDITPTVRAVGSEITS